MDTEPGVREQAPERIYMHPTSAEANVNPWPLEPGEYVEYIRADLAATRMREACVRELQERLRDPSLKFDNDGFRAVVIDWTNMLIRRLESLTLDGEKER